MNHLPNGVVAVGAPGSVMRARAEQEDTALGIIRKAYREQETLPTLAINQDANCIGAWDTALNRFVVVACYSISEVWVSMPYELLVNGKHLPQTWKEVPRG
jgi:hypothetical protein